MRRANIQHTIGLCLGFLLLVVPPIIAFVFLPLTADTVEAAPQGLPVISLNDVDVDEDIGQATIVVTLNMSPSITEPVTIDYYTQAGTATAGTDYNDASGTLTIVNGSTNASFNITINDDAIDEPDETVNINLINANNATFSGGDSFLVAELTIEDDDPPPTSTPTATATGDQPIFSDDYEPNNSFDDATDIAVNQRLCDFTLWPIGDEDFFQFVGIAGRTYLVFTDNLSPGLDTVLTVYGPQGNVIASNDNLDGSTLRSQVRFTAPIDGFYFARVINQDPSDPTDKTYCFEVQQTEPLTLTPSSTPLPGDECEYNSTVETACLIAPDETKTLNFVPTLGSLQDTDVFRMWVKTGIHYTCETSNLSTYADTNIILWDANGNPFNPWIGNDDKEPEEDSEQPEFGSKVTYISTYTGWLYIVVGPVNPPRYEEAHLHTYELTCTALAATATPTPTATFPPLPPSTGGTGGAATNTPEATPTPFIFPTQFPTPTPFSFPTSTPTPTPPIIQFQPLPTATPFAGSSGQSVTINVTLYYDVNNSFTPELTEGIANVAVFLYDNATGNLVSFGSTNETGVARFPSVMVSGPVRVVVPFLGYTKIVVGNTANELLRIPPQPLPIGIP